MNKPQLYINSSYAFDARYEHEFYYLWSFANNQSVANTLVIRDNETNTIVYNTKQETLLLKHVLPANTLQNGKTYNVCVQVFDRDNNASEFSNQLIFKCYTTPTFSLNVVSEQVIRSSSYLFTVNYEQPEGEELQYYSLELYDGNKQFLYNTGARYNIEAGITLTDFMDNESYYVKAYGQTINHMEIETDLILFHVEYIKPEMYSYMTVENREAYGDVQFTSFLVSIEGRGVNGDPTFIDGDYVDTITGNAICFDENFSISAGKISVTGKGFILNQPFLIIKNSNYHTMTFTWKYGTYEQENDIEKWYVELKCVDGKVITYHISNFILLPDSEQLIDIQIKIVNSYIDITVKEVEEETPEEVSEEVT